MRIRMTKMTSGTHGVREVGSVHDVPDDEGKALIEANAAEALEGAPAAELGVAADEPETASVEAPEKAVRKAGRPRKPKE